MAAVLQVMFYRMAGQPQASPEGYTNSRSRLQETEDDTQVLFFLGKMFRSTDLPWLVQFFIMFYNDQPGKTTFIFEVPSIRLDKSTTSDILRL